MRRCVCVCVCPWNSYHTFPRLLKPVKTLKFTPHLLSFQVIEAANRRKKDLQNLARRVIEVMAEEGHNESTSVSNATKTDAAAAAPAVASV